MAKEEDVDIGLGADVEMEDGKCEKDIFIKLNQKEPAMY
jgi:hypothetical protein